MPRVVKHKIWLRGLVLAMLMGIVGCSSERKQIEIVSTTPPDREEIVTTSSLPAFPTAEGFGASSVGGRGGRVIEVTNLNDSGPGSLRAALKAKGRRIVVFRVAGIIELNDAIRLNQDNSYLTIAGQTAPGGGILLKGTNNNLLMIRKGAHDIIIRYLRLRNGSGKPNGFGNDNLTINGGHDIIVDHVSMSWSTDENAAIYRKIDDSPIYNVTIQRSIMAEGLAGHSNGMLVGGKVNYTDPDNPIEIWQKIDNLSIHHNLFAHNSHRNPRVTAAQAQAINNVVYNWKNRIGSTTRGSIFDYINNYAKLGPMRAKDWENNPDYVRKVLMIHEHLSPERPQEPYSESSIYTAGNIVEPDLHTDPDADNWVLWKLNYSEPKFEPLPDKLRRLIPLPPAPIPVRIQSAYEAYDSVLADVGANARLDCLGNWVSNADSVDQRLLADIKNNTGPKEPISSNPNEVGGYPKIVPGTPCTDSDHDGMPDEWENKHRFNPNDSSDGSDDVDGDGYTNVEKYLNG